MFPCRPDFVAIEGRPDIEINIGLNGPVEMPIEVLVIVTGSLMDVFAPG